MIPYSTLFFFYVLILVLIPAVVLGILEKRIKIYGLFASLYMIYFIFGSSKIQSLCLILFYIGELILVKLYQYIRKKYKHRWILWLFTFLSLIPLIAVKWGHIFTSRAIGFLGISYLTFKVIQILIEMYDGLIDEISFIDFTYFLLFFPTISSGPIDRSRRFNDDLKVRLSRVEYLSLLEQGIKKVFMGLAYKFIIASLISTYWMNKVPSLHSFKNFFSYMYAYSFYLFFDFAGYSLIAIGVSYILGVRTPDNFNKPFISKDIKEFWNRWHMSLSFWFRDFVYTRFVMTSLKKKRFKNRFTASYIGYVINMVLMGIWHGTENYYVLYGIYHAILIIGTDLFQRKSKAYKKYKNSAAYQIIAIVVTFNLVCLGFVIFSGKLFK